MAEVYSSLFKGLVHITTKFSNNHKAIDMGNYKTRNAIYSPNKLGNGKVTKQTTSYTYNGILYKNSLTQWITYESGFESCTVHGSTTDKILNVGDKVIPGQLVYRTGNTGYSFGDHLHYQLKKNGVIIDPTPYVINDKIEDTPVSLCNDLQHKELQDKVITLENSLKTCETTVKSLSSANTQLGVENTNLKEELKSLNDDYQRILEERNRFESDYMDNVRELNELKNRKNFIERFLEYLNEILDKKSK